MNKEESDTVNFSEYDDETLKHLQNIATMILKDFDNICINNNIKYFLSSGTALGAIRHKGFIPWDDDVDVMMFREEYYKLLEIINQFSEKYNLLSIETTENYFRQYAKLSLKNTRTNEHWDKNTNFKLGISLDIFIIDFLPKNYLKKKLFIKKWKVNNKILGLLEFFTIDIYSSPNRKKLGKLIKKIFKTLHINQKFFIKQRAKISTNKNNSNEAVILSNECIEIAFPLEIFNPPKKTKFENINLCIPNDCHTYLKKQYGDYMKIPPEGERETHSYNIEFGPY